MESESTHSWFLGYNFVYQEGVDWKWIDTNGNAPTIWNKTLYLSPAAVGGGSLETKRGIPLNPWKVLRGSYSSVPYVHHERISTSNILFSETIEGYTSFQNFTDERWTETQKIIQNNIATTNRYLGTKQFQTKGHKDIYGWLKTELNNYFGTLTGTNSFNFNNEPLYNFKFETIKSSIPHINSYVGNPTLRITDVEIAFYSTVLKYNNVRIPIFTISFNYRWYYTTTTIKFKTHTTSSTTTPTITIT